MAKYPLTVAGERNTALSEEDASPASPRASGSGFLGSRYSSTIVSSHGGRTQGEASSPRSRPEAQHRVVRGRARRPSSRLCSAPNEAGGARPNGQPDRIWCSTSASYPARAFAGAQPLKALLGTEAVGSQRPPSATDVHERPQRRRNLRPCRALKASQLAPNRAIACRRSGRRRKTSRAGSPRRPLVPPPVWEGVHWAPCPILRTVGRSA